jgi:Leucine-rich repeat (LRR) protein
MYALNLSDNQITAISTPGNVSYFSSMTYLGYLSLNDNNIRDFTTLYTANDGGGLNDLVELELSGNQITFIPENFRLPELTSLYLVSNQINDLQPLVDGGVLNGPATLYLNGNPLGNVNVPNEINGPEGLTSDGWDVDLTVNIPDQVLLSAIQQVLIEKEIIPDASTPITPADLAAIDTFSAYGGDSNITSLEGLQYCTSLWDLELPWNRISDLTPISNLAGLAYLDLDHNQVGSLKGLNGLTGLKTLSLEYNNIEDVAALVHDSWAEINSPTIDLYGNPLESGNICNEINELTAENCAVETDTCD